MLLTLDVGNTNTVLGVFRESKLIAHWRLTTARDQTVDEYGILTRNLFSLAGLEPKEIQGVIISSVVPPLNRTLEEMSKKYFEQTPLFVEPGVKTGMAGLVEKPLEVRRLEIRRADGPHEPGLHDADKAVEGVDITVLVGVRPMNQQQVDILKPEPRETGFAGLTNAGDAVPRPVELAGHEDLVARDARAGNALAHAAFVLIVLCRIDEPVAGLEGRRDSSSGLRIVHRPSAQAKGRHLHAVRQRDARSTLRGHSHLRITMSGGSEPWSAYGKTAKPEPVVIV